jgi:hypothetical protein
MEPTASSSSCVLPVAFRNFSTFRATCHTNLDQQVRSQRPAAGANDASVGCILGLWATHTRFMPFPPAHAHALALARVWLSIGMYRKCRALVAAALGPPERAANDASSLALRLNCPQRTHKGGTRGRCNPAESRHAAVHTQACRTQQKNALCWRRSKRTATPPSKPRRHARFNRRER